ncbi:DUF6314 family protein [Pseudarthrobacter albicanus]|uniref:DUF6314 family protein n=1 Tax=Pseudarthrobacter albicanus TaxID=2823873 RepID=UPI001BA47CAB|nr:DUF6314 family protein [Pseudarthrobacter albicanus]
MNPPAPDAGPDFDLRAYLLGAWSVDRTLLDRATGTRGTFTGVVRFTAVDDGGGLSFHEEGTVRLTATAMDGEPFTGPASRNYLFNRTESPDAMDVAFPDGRPFHRMSFRPDASQDQHWCEPDTYRVTYTLHGPDHFSYAWDVRGPGKDQLLESVLRRLDPAG